MSGEVREAIGRFGVRARLLSAFGLLLALMFAIAGIAWIGFDHVGEALDELQQESLVDVEQTLRLAQQSASLAARAPAVANAQILSQIEDESTQLRVRLDAFLRLLEEIGRAMESRPLPDRAAVTRLREVGRRLADSLLDLMAVTRASVLHTAEVQAHRYRIGQLGATLAQASAGPDAAAAAILASDLKLLEDAADGNAQPGVADLQRRFADQALPVLAAWPAASPLAGAAQEILRLGMQPGPLFDALVLQDDDRVRRQFLLNVSATLAGQLSDEVAVNVERVRAEAARRSAATGAALDTGRTRIALLGVLGACAVVLASVYVVRDLGGRLSAVTAAMRRLAAGDRAVDMPATERPDEIGVLARTFQVFREHAFRLDQTTRLLETVFEHMNDGMAVFDAEGCLRACNPRVTELYGSAGRLLPGMPMAEVRQILGAEGSIRRNLAGDPLDAAFVDRARQAGSQRFEETLPDGRVLELRSNPMPDGGFVSVYIDLSERKGIEAQLEQARKMESVGQLTGGMAHDFNNLLAAVIGNLQVALDAEPDTAAARLRYLKRALAAAERGTAITQRLLAFSRKQSLQPQTLDLNELVEGMLDLLRFSVGEAIAVDTALAPASTLVRVDPGELENALMNLAINSRDAMPGGGRLRIVTRIEPAAPGPDGNPCEHVLLEVVDNGCGIPHEVLDRVFEPFFTTKALGAGSGLGLSMVYGFVRQSGGEVTIESEPGANTTVRLRFPRAAPAEPLPAFTGQTVLVVDDEPDTLLAASAQLRALGLVALTAADREGALECLRTARVELLLSDVYLAAGMTGPQVVAEARAQQPGLPVLFASGYPLEALAERGIVLDAACFLQKPYRRDALAARIAAVLAAPA